MSNLWDLESRTPDDLGKTRPVQMAKMEITYQSRSDPWTSRPDRSVKRVMMTEGRSLGFLTLESASQRLRKARRCLACLGITSTRQVNSQTAREPSRAALETKSRLLYFCTR